MQYVQVQFQPSEARLYTYRTDLNLKINDLVLVEAKGHRAIVCVRALGRGPFQGIIKSVLDKVGKETTFDPDKWEVEEYYGDHEDQGAYDVCCMLYPEPHDVCYLGEGEWVD